jgi:succinate dehydrogenase cytochrome b556 subunit/succinate dehydrogenase hydrophobic membrane anchor protein
LIAWAHRVSGAALAAYMVAHLLTLAALQQPERFDRLMQTYRSWPFVLAEWALAVPVIFHALNGGRLILFESFGRREDDRLIRWAAIGSAVYVGVLTLTMLLGDQAVSAAVFWLCAVSAAGCVTAVAAGPIRRSGPGRGWKLQRLSAAWLLLMVPAHMLFMHLNPAAGHDPQMILARLSHPLMKLVDLTLVLAVLGHGAWGLWSIAGDYLARGLLRAAVGTLLLAGGAWLAWLGMRLTITL